MGEIRPSAQLRGGLSRRRLLAGTGLGLAAALLPGGSYAQPLPRDEIAPDGFRVFRARAGVAPLRGEGQLPTPLWGYEGTVPGPLLRLRRGEELKVRLINELTQPSAIHWHGVRVPNAMDGVPGLTQPAVKPRDQFDYRFRPADAGMFWYHAPFGMSDQVGRGLYGVLIVDEPGPSVADRDVLLVFDDWHINQEGAVDEAGSASASEHLTVNSRPDLDIPVRSNERLRLRLLNASTKQLIGVGIEDHPATVMAIDGQPAEPFEARAGRVMLAPGGRADLFVDAVRAPGSTGTIILATSRGQKPIARLTYDAGPAARPNPPSEPTALPANPLPARMDFAHSFKLDLPLDPAGLHGALAGPGLREAPAKRNLRARLWIPAAEFGATSDPGPPLFTVRRGRTVMLGLSNPTSAPVALHVHGHPLRLLDALDDGWKPFWLDTVLVLPNQTARIAFVAEGPGKWLLQGHQIDRAGEGIAAWFAVT